MRVCVDRLPIAFQGFEAVANAELPGERLFVLQLYELLEVFECWREVLLQQQVLASCQVRIWVVWVELNAALQVLDSVLCLAKALVGD